MAYADGLENECVKDPNRAAWDAGKQRWLDLYTGNHFADPLVSSASAAGKLEPEQMVNRIVVDTVKLVYNRVMNAVLAMLAGQISNPPKVVFGARESGEPPIYYLNGFVQHPIVQQMAMQLGAQDERVQQLDAIYGRETVQVQPQQPVEGAEPGEQQEQPQVQEQMHPETAKAAMQAGMSVPLPTDMAMQLKAMIDQGKMVTAQARMAGMPVPLGIVPPEALVEITDQTTAQFTQTVFDGLWEQSGGREAASENILNKKVLGWQPTLVEFDRTKIDYGESPLTLTNVEGTQIYFDPQTSSYRPPRYIIMLEPVTWEEAKAKYPDLDWESLKGKFDSGTLTGRGRDRQGRLFDLDSARDRCVIRTLWHRHWMYPMNPDEAMNCGKVTLGSVPTGAVEQVPDVATGQPIGTRNVMRQAFLLTDTGEETDPTKPNWPGIYAIREIRDIEGEVIFDRRCKTKRMPIENNINIPIPFSPYGIGEPDRLDGLQMAINRVLSDAVAHHHHDAFPPEFRHQAVADGIPLAARKRRTQSSAVINVPRSVANEVQGDLSNLGQYMELPPMPAESWKLLEFLVVAIDKEANNSEVSQGLAPSGTSGQWVANLQAAAAQVAQVTSQATEGWLKNIVQLIVEFIANDMTEKDVMRYTSKYPSAIVAAFKKKQKQLYHDITVEIQSGSAAGKTEKTQAMVALRQAGVQGISDPSILEGVNLDPDAELEQQVKWMEKLRDSGLIQAQAEQGQDRAANNGGEGRQQGNAA